jgi:transcriptional regulator with XRE-family HTH domain
MTQTWWEEALHKRIAGAIRDARRQRRMSANELADETERLGYGVSRSQIANYESGRKKSLDVAELIVLAAALRVPPLQLLFPDEPDDDIEMLPGQRTSRLQAIVSFTGGPGPMWPSQKVADLTETLQQLSDAIAGLRPAGEFPYGLYTDGRAVVRADPTAGADVKSKEEKE